MIKSLRHIAIICALGVGSSTATLPASAKLGLGVDTDVTINGSVRGETHQHRVHDR
jgi:hypothetical protein